MLTGVPRNVAENFGSLGICPHCLHPLDLILPVEPVLPLKVAAPLIPMSHAALRKYLENHAHEFPRRYRRDKQRRLHRLLTSSEIRLIRSRILRFKNPDKTRRDADAFGA